jgi:hypothetical protein
MTLSFEELFRDDEAQLDEAVVYFVALDGDCVKIGTTRKLRERLKAFETGSARVELLLAIPGGFELEYELHSLLAEAKVARELFRYDPVVRDFIEGFKDGGIEGGIARLAPYSAAPQFDLHVDKRSDEQAHDYIACLPALPIKPAPTPAARRKARTEAMRRWRRNEREGKRLVYVAIDAPVLDWLARHYPGQCNPDDLADVGRLIGEILRSSAEL